MKVTRRCFSVLRVGWPCGLLMWMLFAVPVYANPPTKKQVDTLINTSRAAEKAAQTAGQPLSERKRQREDLLDAKERAMDEAQETVDRLKKNKRTSKKSLDRAKKDLESKTFERDAARAAADKVPPKGGNPYRTALGNKRKARKALQKAQEDLMKVSGGEGRALRKKIREELERSKPKSGSGLPSGAGGFLSMESQLESGALGLSIAGTGLTIGEVADLTLKNGTDKPVQVNLPPMVLVSRSGATQHYVVPGGQVVTVQPGEKVTLPLSGMCISRSKPPVAEGIATDLYVQLASGVTVYPAPSGNLSVPTMVVGGVAALPEGEGNPQPADIKTPVEGGPAFTPDQVATLLTRASAINQAVEELQANGNLDAIPYPDPVKRQEAAEQWATWADPIMSEITGEDPADKEDLKETVMKQIPPGVELTPEQDEQIQTGIDSIWGAIELTGSKAKSIASEESPFTGTNPTLKEF